MTEPMVHEDVVSCEDCGCEIVHTVVSGNECDSDPNYYMCDNCLANEQEN